MGRDKLEDKVLRFVQRHNLLPPGETVIVAVSGGADSVCLLHILATFQRRLGIDLHVAHFNHQLRGAESEADAEYVSRLATSLGIPVIIEAQDTGAYRAERGGSIEEVARELRYAFLARVARDLRAKRIATGHTRDDHVETILMHLLRGTGIIGLRGLLPLAPLPYTSAEAKETDLLVVRPLLNVTREETMSYCRDHRLDPRVDSSNLSLSLFRNRLRLHLLPLLRQYNRNIDQALLRLADIATEAHAFIEHEALKLWTEVARQEDALVRLNKKKLASLPLALQSEILRLALASLVKDVRDIEAQHIKAARRLLSQPAGKRLCLPHNLMCLTGYDYLDIAVITTERPDLLTLCPFPPLTGEFRLNIPGETFLPGWKITAQINVVSPPPYSVTEENNLVAHLDLHKTGTLLFVRKRQPGDRFQPLGMNVPKKLYRFMIDAKIPASWRDHIPVVFSPEHIVWVVGLRIDDRAKVTAETREILRLEFARWP